MVRLDPEDLFIGSILLIVGGMIGLYILSQNKEIVRIVEKESENNKKRFMELHNLLGSSKKSLQIGGRLVFYSTKITRVVDEIEKLLDEINGEMVKLDEEMQMTESNNNVLQERTENVNQIIKNQSSFIEESSSSIIEMSNSINSISDISKSKLKVINQLSGTIKESREEVNKSIDSINKISESSSSVLEVINVIVNISNKTNLLAMNAAIEAAHAGTSGAGFAVVAEEIRKLADEASVNTKLITQTLNSNIKDVNTAVEIIKNTGEYFNKIDKEVIEVANAMDEIIGGTGELSAGTKDIMALVDTLVSGTEETKNSVIEMKDSVNKNYERIKNVKEQSENNKEKIKLVVNEFDDIVTDSNTIKDIGMENIENMEGLNKELTIINKKLDSEKKTEQNESINLIASDFKAT
jgi:methyl-accepting chemotaxis protein